MAVKTCIVCGRLLEGRRSNALYCKDCAKEAHKACCREHYKRAMQRGIDEVDSRVCRICGKDISNRRMGAVYCSECATTHTYYRPVAFKACRHIPLFNRTPEERDTLLAPILEKQVDSAVTGIECTYLICPVCRCTLNKSDRFCRFCGQRVREEV